MTPEQRREVNEAVLAGRCALASLEEASEALESASRWGALDIFTGGLLGVATSIAKHSKMGSANEALAAARADLRAFTRELSDVSSIEELRLDVGGLNVAIDILLDNPLVDVYVQKKIDDAQDVVEAAITATRTVLGRLEAM